MYDTTETPQARSTDPLTSKIASARVNSGEVRNWILHHLQMNGPSDVWQISQGTGIKETTVSSQMRPLARKGLVHEAGMRPSDETGCYRIVWAFGPGKGDPLDQTPIVKRGRTKTSDRIQFRPFTMADFQKMAEEAKNAPELFLVVLNREILERVW